MERGTVRVDTLPNLLRSIAQRRRQGVLLIETEPEVLRLFFVQGKVVEALRGTETSLSATQSWLERAEIDTSGATVPADLLQSLDAELLKRSVRHRILDRVFSLSLVGSTPYTFSVQVVEYDERFQPQLSVGQILLDLVAEQAEADRFDATFGAGGMVVAQGNALGGLAEDEESLMRLVRNPVDVSMLEQRSLLCPFHFRVAILSLHEQGLVRIEAGTAPQGVEAFLEAVETSLEQAEAVGVVESAGAPAVPAREALNERMLHSSDVPKVVVWCGLLALVCIPAFLWHFFFAAF